MPGVSSSHPIWILTALGTVSLLGQLAFCTLEIQNLVFNFPAGNVEATSAMFQAGALLAAEHSQNEDREPCSPRSGNCPTVSTDT